jgi:hypothetical protein
MLPKLWVGLMNLSNKEYAIVVLLREIDKFATTEDFDFMKVEISRLHHIIDMRKELRGEANG